MAASSSTFGQLVDRFRVKGLDKDEPPRSYLWVSKKFGISRQFLYDLMNGAKPCSEELKERIAAAADVTVTTVRRSLKTSELVGR